MRKALGMANRFPRVSRQTVHQDLEKAHFTIRHIIVFHNFHAGDASDPQWPTFQARRTSRRGSGRLIFLFRNFSQKLFEYTGRAKSRPYSHTFSKYE